MKNDDVNFYLNDASILKKVMLENSSLPLLILHQESLYGCKLPYNQAEIGKVGIKTLTLHNEYWITKKEYREELVDKIRYLNNWMTEKEIQESVNRELKEVEFIKAVVVPITY